MRFSFKAFIIEKLFRNARFLFLSVVILFVEYFALPGEAIISSDSFKLSVDTSIHNDYGLSYPATYQFSIPSGSSNLKTYKKYRESDTWTQIPEKTKADFFNGIEAVMFDYANNKAYVSVAFSKRSDNIFLKITDEFGNSVDVTYDKITKYYDNRDAAVVFSADDWDGDEERDLKFRQACDMFPSKKIWLSVAIITQGYHNEAPAPVWSHLQNKIDAGYIEANSHTRHHWRQIEYDGYYYNSEIGGSKEDIINNLELPSIYRKGDREYVWGWIAPYSLSNYAIRYYLGRYRYLSDVSGDFDTGGGDFPDWDSYYNVYKNWNRWGLIENKTLSNLKSEFDERINEGKIYHIGFHPLLNDFSPGSRIGQFTDYVKERKNLWYTGCGALMMYHYVENQDIVTIYGIIETLNKLFAYPNPCYPDKGQVVKITNLPLNVGKVYIYTVGEELVKCLGKGNGITEEAGFAKAVWDCRNENGQKVARGIYVYLITTVEGEKRVGKIAIIK